MEKENQYVKQFPDLMSGKKVMYVHGFGSSAQSGTVTMLRTLLPETTVIAEDIPLHPEEGMAMLRQMQQEEFAKLEKGLRTRAALQENVRNVLLELSCAGMSYQELDSRLSGAIRQEDAVGLKEDRVFLLLHDVDDTGMQLVRQRLLHRGIEVLESRELV